MSKKYSSFAVLTVLLVLFLAAFTAPSKSFNTTHPKNDTLPAVLTKAKDHKGKSVVSTSGIISFTTGLDNDYYYLDSINREGYLYIETKLRKFLNDNIKRVPLNISVVIDRSGSMQGEKMEFARKAAKDIIDKLKEEDFVSIVVYDNDVEVIQPAIHPINKDAIKIKIDQIAPRGSTNLWGGSEVGYYQVQDKYKPGFINRVLLISDGLVNQGITSAKAIKMNVQRFKDENGITISTFGVGLDYNEVLMTDMAEAGAGNYYFIDAADKMALMFDKELNGLLSVAAQNAELIIKLPKGIKIEKAYPLKYEEKGEEVSIKFRDLFSEETKGILLKFTMKDDVKSVLKFICTISYIDVSTGQKKSLINENTLSPVKNVDAYVTHFNKAVLEQTVLFTANENMEKAMMEADMGNYDKAFEVLKANRFYLERNATYVSGYAPLKQMDSANTSYSSKLVQVREMGKDSVKKLQKSSRSDSYQIRNKKQ